MFHNKVWVAYLGSMQAEPSPSPPTLSPLFFIYLFFVAVGALNRGSNLMPSHVMNITSDNIF